MNKHIEPIEEKYILFDEKDVEVIAVLGDEKMQILTDEYENFVFSVAVADRKTLEKWKRIIELMGDAVKLLKTNLYKYEEK